MLLEKIKEEYKLEEMLILINSQFIYFPTLFIVLSVLRFMKQKSAAEKLILRKGDKVNKRTYNFIQNKLETFKATSRYYYKK